MSSVECRDLGLTGRTKPLTRKETMTLSFPPCRSSIADRSKLDDEPMGDALYFGAKGFLDYSKRELNSIPMGAYSGAALGGKPVLILWAHDNKIKFIPEVVGLMTALTDLRLHDNQIDKLPDEFGNLASIRRLWLNNNILEKCPDTLGKLTTLEMLSLSNNPFTELNTGIGNLVRLKDLMLDGLKLEVINSSPHPHFVFNPQPFDHEP